MDLFDRPPSEKTQESSVVRARSNKSIALGSPSQGSKRIPGRVPGTISCPHDRHPCSSCSSSPSHPHPRLPAIAQGEGMMGRASERRRRRIGCWMQQSRRCRVIDGRVTEECSRASAWRGGDGALGRLLRWLSDLIKVNRLRSATAFITAPH